jgi:hypothetical protein
MTSPHFLVTLTVSCLIVALLWGLKMVLDKRRSTFPSELPERPPKLSLKKRPSQKTGSSEPTSYGSTNVSPPFPTKQSTLLVVAPSTSFTNDVIAPHVLARHNSITIENNIRTSAPTDYRTPRLKKIVSAIGLSRSSNAVGTRSSPPRDAIQIEKLHDIFRKSSQTHQKPISSTTHSNVKDPLIQRFERLKIPSTGRLQPRSFVPAVLPPLSPSSTIPSREPTNSGHSSFHSVKQIWNKMAGSSATEPRLPGVSSAHQSGGDFSPHTQTSLRVGSKAKQPIVIDDTDAEDGPNSIVNRFQKSFQRPKQAHNRMPTYSRQRTTSVARQLRRRSRSPTISDSGSQADLTPTSSEDISYPDLSVHLVRPQQSPKSEWSKVHALSKNDVSIPQEELDRQLAERLEKEEREEYHRTQSLYAQLRTDAGQPSTSSIATNTSQKAHLRVGLTAISHRGTRDDPIDLESYYSDSIAFGGRMDIQENDLEAIDIDEEDWNFRNELDAVDTSMDAFLAQQLQEEEERSRVPIVATRACVVCDESHPISDLPSLAECEHLPQTCATCYSEWLAAQLEGSGWREAKCPESECQTKLNYYEIHQLATPETFQQYDTFIARAAISEDRKFW